MGYLGWHYTYGVEFYLRRYFYAIRWVNHFFSPTLLIATLFAPWKKLLDTTKKPGFDFVRYFEKLSFNFVSRFVGAITRLVLFFIGTVALLLLIVFGALGLVVWLVMPFLSLGLYMSFRKSPRSLAVLLFNNINSSPKNAISTLFNNEAGEFVLKHVGLTLPEVTANAKLNEVKIENFEPTSYTDLISYFLEKGVWDEDFFRRKSILSSDLTSSAKWWDKRQDERSRLDATLPLGRPGIGLELLYGYTPTLDQYSSDLGIPQEFYHHLIGRQNMVSRMERVLTSGNSVILVGAPGVGKKTVVLEFARRASLGELGKEMSYKRIMEVDPNFLFSGSSDLNQKKSKLATILNEAAEAGNIIMVMRDLHRVTDLSLEGLDFTDTFETFLEKRKLRVIAISATHDYEKFLSQNYRLKKFFEVLEVTQPTKEEAMDILLEASERWERLKPIVIMVGALRKMLEGSDRYITETPFPEKALEILDAAIMFEEQEGEDGVVDVADVDKVLSEKTGISFARITESEKKRLTNLEEIIHERLVNQDEAVRLISQILRGKSVGVVSTKRPLGSFLFLGPTGVGKTETAKVLAKVYFGSGENILRFDMAEYAGAEGLERLIGSQAKNEAGALTTAIKNRPASLLLLDEIEKSPAAVFNLFLSLLDEGVITDAFGRKISCSNLFVIATSNAGAEHVRSLISKGTRGEELQREVIDYVLKKGLFSPEFVNRFDGTVVYEPLERPELLKVARLMLTDLAKNLKEKNVNLEFSDEAYEKVVDRGYDPAFGARPMRRVIELELGDLIGKAILSGEIKSGDGIKVVWETKEQKFKWEKARTG